MKYKVVAEFYDRCRTFSAGEIVEFSEPDAKRLSDKIELVKKEKAEPKVVEEKKLEVAEQKEMIPSANKIFKGGKNK